jgi:hypothetical protein
MPFCDQAGHCSRANTICSAVAVGRCNVPDAGGADGGQVPGCGTDFLCYPNRCAR